jgi:hypothetical protein
MLTVDDLRSSRLVVQDPAPIPADELQRSYEWIRSWGMLEGAASTQLLVDRDTQDKAHAAAE